MGASREASHPAGITHHGALGIVTLTLPPLLLPVPWLAALKGGPQLTKSIFLCFTAFLFIPSLKIAAFLVSSRLPALNSKLHYPSIPSSLGQVRSCNEPQASCPRCFPARPASALPNPSSRHPPGRAAGLTGPGHGATQSLGTASRERDPDPSPGPCPPLPAPLRSALAFPPAPDGKTRAVRALLSPCKPFVCILHGYI